MRLHHLAELLDCEVLVGQEHVPGIEVRHCFAADLMSDVLRFSDSGTLLITGLASVQSVHTADVADLVAVLYVAGKRPAQTVVDMAHHKGIPLLTTRHGMFEACGLLYQAHVPAAHSGGTAHT
jgi:predicted transcriptional regulator